MADQFLTLIDQEADEIKKRLPEYISPDRFILMAKNYNRAIKMSKELSSCRDDALLQCVKDAADRGLEIGSPAKHCAIVPFATKSGGYFPVLIVQWQGKGFLWIQSGAIVKLRAKVAYAWDEFSWDEGAEHLHHVQDESDHSPADLNNINNIKAAWAEVTLPSGLKQYSVVFRSDLVRTMEAVKRKNNGKLGFGWTDWLPEMCRKTAVHRLDGFIQPPPKMTAEQRAAFDLSRTPDNFEDIDIDRIKQAEAANADIDNPPAREAKVEVVQDGKGKPVNSDADEPIDSDTADACLKAWKQHHRVSELSAYLFERFNGIEDIEQLTKKDVGTFLKGAEA